MSMEGIVGLMPGLRDLVAASQQQVYMTPFNGGAAGNHTVTGIAKSDVLLAVLMMTRRRVSSIAGGAAGDHTLTGITAADRLEGVHDIDTTSGVLVDLTAEFSIDSADTINNDGGTASTRLVIYWDDLGADLTTEFSISAANTINNAGGTASTNHNCVAVWLQGS
ncbi:MAG: hypothetical protein GY788_21055 [bacterium]|nr:hypothetical protein [bacterium]